MTTLVMLGILLFGLMAYKKLPVSDLPNVDYPTIQVQASLPGASPETMAAAVATPLIKPPPPTATSKVSMPGCWRSISNASVPWPAASNPAVGQA